MQSSVAFQTLMRLTTKKARLAIHESQLPSEALVWSSARSHQWPACEKQKTCNVLLQSTFSLILLHSADTMLDLTHLSSSLCTSSSFSLAMILSSLVARC